MKLDNEIECSWLEPVFKEGKDLVGGLNEDSGSSLKLLANLEEEWEGEWLMLEEVFFNAGINLETDEDMCSC